MTKEEMKREINRLNLSIATKVWEIICLVVFSILLAITAYDYFFLQKDPSNFRIMLILIMIVQWK
jgi:hypothetical protein